MTISSVLTELEEASHPIAKALHKDHHFKVLVFGFKKGMRIDVHSSKAPAKFTVIEGKIIFRTEKASITLEKFDETAIPVGVSHWFEAEMDSLALLTQSWNDEHAHTTVSNDFVWEY